METSELIKQNNIYNDEQLRRVIISLQYSQLQLYGTYTYNIYA